MSLNIIPFVKLLRPHQWLKNLFCFLPLFFGRHLLDIDYLIPGVIGFFAFSLMSSAIYCFNDIYDVESDKLHPVKRNRPIANGSISKMLGYVMMLMCVVLSLSLISVGSFYENANYILLLTIIIGYFILNILYCIVLKQISIIDVFVISVGFVLRVLLGGVITGIWLSEWLILMTFLVALFLAFAKRRDDVIIYENTGISARSNIKEYNITYMNIAISIVASVTMVCYIMYSVSPDVTQRFGSDYVYLTSVFVLAGIMRYLQVAIVEKNSGSPTVVLLYDRFIQICLLCWAIAFCVILYL